MIPFCLQCTDWLYIAIEIGFRPHLWHLNPLNQRCNNGQSSISVQAFNRVFYGESREKKNDDTGAKKGGETTFKAENEESFFLRAASLLSSVLTGDVTERY